MYFTHRFNLLRNIGAVCAFLISTATSAQSEHPDWSTLMKDPSVSFDSIVQLHESLWPTPPSEPGSGYKPFQRYKWLYEQRLSEQGTIPSGNDVWRTWEDLKHHLASRSPMGNWQPLGPVLDDITTRDEIEGVGRTSALAFHPTDPDRMLCGTPAGGLWSSGDGGQNWSSNTDWLPTLGVSAIVYHPTNPEVVFIGTGDRDAGDAPGMGVMKSTDGGLTWALSNVGIENKTVGAMKYLQSTNALIAATNQGIFRSLDEGLTWTLETTVTFDFKDLDVHPTNDNILYAAGAGRFYRSEDGGDNWEYINEGLPSGTRMVIAVTPADPNRVYVCRSSTYVFTGFFRSDDTGLNFTEVSDSPNILGWAADGSSSSGQAWYDLCIEADWNNPDIVYVGGIRVKKSVDGGATWLDINPNYIHVDQHEFVISPYTQELYVCNDGGLYRYIDNEHWLDISTGIVNGQIYRLGQNPMNPNDALTGFQDNGTAEFNGAQWYRRGGGDGFECIYDYTDPTWRYGSIYYGQLYRTSPDFINQKIGGDGELGINESGAWSTPYLLHPDSVSTMFLGMKNVWRSKNIKHPERDSIVWQKISTNLMGNNSENMIAMRFSKADHRILYASKAQRRLARTLDAMADEVVWTNLSATLPSSLQPVNCIETHPVDTHTVYIGFNRDVWKSADGGLTWANLTADFPDVQINSIAMDTTSAWESLYIGTDQGIYYHDTAINEWISFNNGFPLASRVTELEIYYGDTPDQHRIKAATYGRGLWESDLYSTDTYPFGPVALVRNPYATNEVFGQFDAELLFYRNLELVPVTGLTIEDITVENGVLTGISGGPSEYTLQIIPADYGPVNVVLPALRAEDESGMGNYASDTLRLVYVPEPEPFGPFGPGGVGDDNSITFWLRADESTQALGGGNASDGLSVQRWTSITGTEEYDAEQSDAARMPLLVEGESGIHGKPAIEFDGVNDYLLASGVVPGRSISGYMIAETDSVAFNDHGWFASARVNNGYLMHPWKDQSSYSAEVLDAGGGYSGSPVYYIGDATAPHIYGFIHEQTDLHQVFFTVFDDQLWSFPGIHIGERNSATPIDIRMGWDYEDRYGKGRIGEHFIYNRRLFITHHNLVNNYLAMRYGIDLGLQRRYTHVAHPEELFGIGRESTFDRHVTAQGRGILQLGQAQSLDNGDYLIIGDNGSSTALTTTAFPFLSARMQREWGATETGDAGNVRVSIEASLLEEFAQPGIILTEGFSFEPGSTTSYYPFEFEGNEANVWIDFPSESVFTIGETPLLSELDLPANHVHVFPNPANEQLTMVTDGGGRTLWDFELVNVLGQTVHQGRFSGNKHEEQVTQLAVGSYRLVLKSESKMISTSVVITR
ncbi:MAG: T9SS type A sorting domain-containing protein [Flavobacteriales bacterium]